MSQDKTLLDTAAVYDVAIESPLEAAEHLTQRLGFKVLLKREDLQPVHSFKLRGAHNKIKHLSPEQRAKGVIAASAGNHAQGVALSAQKLGISALIVMPRTTPDIKVQAVKNYGAEVVLAGDSYSEAYEHCTSLIQSEARVFIHPFDDLLVIAGQGTIGQEILVQSPDVTHIMVPVGGGGLIAGIAEYVKSVRPEVQIIGVEPEDSSAMHDSLAAGRRVTLDHVGIFADGVAVKQVGKLTYSVAKKHVDQVITVDNDHICAAIKSIFEETRSIVEPAGALAVAGTQVLATGGALSSDSVVVAICSGANMSFERLQFVAERTLLGSGQEALFAVRLPETAGALSKFCTSVVNGFAITEFNYRLSSRSEAYIFVGVGLKSIEDRRAFIGRLKQHGYTYHDLSLDDLAKEHVRHMIGGVSTQVRDEVLYEVQIPERPGALNDFLHRLGDKWNISLFHYRGQGADQGSVLIGFEAKDVAALNSQLQQAQYEFRIADSKALEIFI
ncbi:MAG: threonine ammonia-lyase, biosynthetic [Patescibacteria group bacterium]